MKSSLYTAALILWSATQISAQDIQAFFDYKVFHVPGKEPFVETYLNVFSNTIQYNEVEGGEQAAIELLILIKKGDDIVDYSKKTLLSRVVNDSIYDDLIDVERFLLPYGDYELELELADRAFPEKKETILEPLKINAPEEGVFFSDIQWIVAYKPTSEPGILTKSGYDMLPYVSNYFPAGVSKMVFYAEVYGTERTLGEGSPLLLSTFIEKKESKNIVESCVSRTKKTSSSVIPVLSQFDITDLPTGNYNLVVEIRDRENNLLGTNKLFFQRTGQEIEETTFDLAEIELTRTFVSELNSLDTSSEYIQCLRPIAKSNELPLITRFEKHKDLELMKRFFYTFWSARNKEQPDVAWQEYKAKVADVNRTYGTAVRKGYDTDMGRVYLAYGPPNTVTDRPSEPNAYPYQIWQYFRADRWTNVRFVFYDRTLLRQDYQLLHCDNIPGEIKNPRWDMLVHQRDTPLRNVDDTRGREHFGGRTQDFGTLPGNFDTGT